MRRQERFRDFAEPLMQAIGEPQISQITLMDEEGASMMTWFSIGEIRVICGFARSAFTTVADQRDAPGIYRSNMT